MINNHLYLSRSRTTLALVIDRLPRVSSFFFTVITALPVTIYCHSLDAAHSFPLLIIATISLPPRPNWHSTATDSLRTACPTSFLDIVSPSAYTRPHCTHFFDTCFSMPTIYRTSSPLVQLYGYIHSFANEPHMLSSTRRPFLELLDSLTSAERGGTLSQERLDAAIKETLALFEQCGLSHARAHKHYRIAAAIVATAHERLALAAGLSNAHYTR